MRSNVVFWQWRSTRAQEARGEPLSSRGVPPTAGRSSDSDSDSDSSSTDAKSVSGVSVGAGVPSALPENGADDELNPRGRHRQPWSGLGGYWGQACVVALFWRRQGQNDASQPSFLRPQASCGTSFLESPAGRRPPVPMPPARFFEFPLDAVEHRGRNLVTL